MEFHQGEGYFPGHDTIARPRDYAGEYCVRTSPSAAMKLRIAIVAHCHYPISRPFHGGLEAHTHSMARELIRRGHDVTVYCATGSDPSINPVPIGPPVKLSMEGEFGIERAIQIQTSLYVNLWRHIDRQGFDVIHNNSLNPAPYVVGSQLQTPVVTVLHTPMLPEISMLAPLINDLKHFRFIAVSKRVAIDWGALGIQSETIWNGLPEEAFVDPQVNLRSADETDHWESDCYKPNWDEPSRHTSDHNLWRIEDKGFKDGSTLSSLAIRNRQLRSISRQHSGSACHAFWFGRITPEKGTLDAIDACRAIGLHLRMAGPLSDEAYGRLVLERLRGVGTYLGHLDHPRLRQELIAAQVAIVTPKWEEPFGLTAAEALAVGCPVAAYDRGVLKSLLPRDVGVVAKADDIEDLSRAIGAAKVLDRRHAYRWARNQFGIARMLDRYLEIYESQVNCQDLQRGALLDSSQAVLGC